MKSALRTLRWLYACWLARRIANQLVFSKRQRFLYELRPIFIHGSIETRPSFPGAWLTITPAEVRRAHEIAKQNPDPLTWAACHRAGRSC